MADEPLAPASVAAVVAPILDRIRVHIAHQLPVVAGDLLQANGLDLVRGQLVGMLRNLMPDRTTRRQHVQAAFRYWPEGQVDQALDQLVAGGLLQESGTDLGLTGAGRQLMLELRARFEQIIGDLWSDHAAAVQAVAPLVDRCVAAAAASGGPSFALAWPVWQPADGSASMSVAEQLTPLRFHRADAHAAAWEAAGLTVSDVQQLGPGPQRDAIEADTNERAAAPYAALSPGERFALVAGLGRLPG